MRGVKNNAGADGWEDIETDSLCRAGVGCQYGEKIKGRWREKKSTADNLEQFAFASFGEGNSSDDRARTAITVMGQDLHRRAGRRC